jgi:hypothetical protein
MGASRRGEIDEAFQNTTNNAMARLQDRGIGGSTFALTAQQGAERQRQHNLNQLQDQLLSQRVGVQQQLGQAGFGALERFIQPQADSGLLVNLLQTIGRGGPGLSGAFGGGGRSMIGQLAQRGGGSVYGGLF